MKKRICFICLVNQFLLPYLKKYISLIDCEYDIIFWNRHGLNETCGATRQYAYELLMDENTSKLKKLRGYIGFARFATKILEENQYDGVVLTATYAGIMLQSTLKKHYKNKYIVDIRDYTLEKNYIYYTLEKRLLKDAAFNVISSEGYKSFLPQGDYVIAHNELPVPLEVVEKFRGRKKNYNEKIVLTYIGLIRFHDQNKKIIDMFCNDLRYEIRFIGADALTLKEYCDKKRVQNVVLIDRFPPEKTFELLWGTDMILNLYGNGTPLLDYALSNKLYYAAKLGIPILVCDKTFMEQISKTYGFGYTVDFNDSEICNKLYNYYHNIDWKNFREKCDLFLQKVNNENKNFESKVEGFSKGGGND